MHLAANEDGSPDLNFYFFSNVVDTITIPTAEDLNYMNDA